MTKGVRVGGQRIGLYGKGGIGKSTLVEQAKQVGQKPLVLDCEQGSRFLDVDRIEIGGFDDLRAAVASDICEDYTMLCIDTATVAEIYCSNWVCDNVPHEKGSNVTIHRIEDYGFGKGYKHIFDEFLNLLADLDRHVRAGRHVVLVMHETTEKVPNPAGEDFLQYQPNLQSPPKAGKLRERVKEWLDHLFYVGYDIHVDKQGKGTGGGTRTIYTSELPTAWAKSRSLSGTFDYELDNPALWRTLLTEEK